MCYLSNSEAPSNFAVIDLFKQFLKIILLLQLSVCLSCAGRKDWSDSYDAHTIMHTENKKSDNKLVKIVAVILGIVFIGGIFAIGTKDKSSNDSAAQPAPNKSQTTQNKDSLFFA